MGLEQRGKQQYYYRKERRGGRVVSVYQGSGLLAQLAAELAEHERAIAQHEQEALRALRAEAEQQAAIVISAAADVRTVVTAVLLANGFYQHKRQWRKAMQHDLPPHDQPTTALVTGAADGERWREGLAALRAAMAIEAQPSTKRGRITEQETAAAERAKRAAVRQVLADYPEIWDRLREVLSSGRRAMIEAMSGGSIGSATGQVLDKSLTALQHDLGYATAPPLEQLMIEQIVLAWADLDYVQMHYAKLAFGNHTLNAGRYWDKRLTSAQTRYTRALEALARVRRLAMPQPLQVNIGGQQVNVAGGGNVGQTSARSAPEERKTQPERPDQDKD